MSDWRHQANCVGMTDSMYPDNDNRNAQAKLYREAKETYCDDCQVRAECLEYALSTFEPYGMWGGTTPMQRAAIARKRRRGGVR